jgi:DNA-3-methyladenine glycosylase II
MKMLPFNDPLLSEAVKHIQLPVLSPVRDYYTYLIRSVVYQQLSGKAASTIYGRFEALFPDHFPEAERIISIPPETFRAVGLSAQKSGYIKNIAEFSLTHDMTDEYLDTLDDEAVIRHLTRIKGVGRWTVEMLLIFAMQRPDVFPLDDYGILTGMEKLYSLPSEMPIKEKKIRMREIAESWKPHRSLATRYIWAWKDGK